MSLWHLLVLISSLAPLMGALAVGKNAGIGGILIALVIGTAVAITNFYCLHITSGYVAGYAESLESELKQELAFISIYLGVLSWGLLTTGLVIYILRLVIPYIHPAP